MAMRFATAVSRNDKLGRGGMLLSVSMGGIV